MSNIQSEGLSSEAKEIIQYYITAISEQINVFKGIYHNIFTEMENFQLKITKSNKHFSCSIIFHTNENLPILLEEICNFFSTFQKLFSENQKQMSNNFQVQIEDFQLQRQDVKEKIFESFNQHQKNYQKHQNIYQTIKQKYAKQCKETEEMLKEKQKMKDEITFYNVTYQLKINIKIRDSLRQNQKNYLVQILKREIDQVEKQCKKEIDEVNKLSQDFSNLIKENFGLMKQLFKTLITMFLEITILNSKSTYKVLETLLKVMDERKLTDIKMNLSFEPNKEDSCLQGKQATYSNNDLDSSNQGINFLALSQKIKNKQELTDKEILCFPECTNKYVDLIKNVSNQRIKNVIAALQFFQEIKDIFENLALKYIAKNNKESSPTKLQIRGLSQKAQTIIDLIQLQNEQIARIYSKFATNIDQKIKQIELISSDQKTQEKQLNNVAEKIFADFKESEKKNVSELKKCILRSADLLIISLQSYRDHEFQRLQNLRQNIQDIMIQLKENCIQAKAQYQELLDNFSAKKDLIDDEIKYAFSSDQKIIQSSEKAYEMNILQFQQLFNQNQIKDQYEIIADDQKDNSPNKQNVSNSQEIQLEQNDSGKKVSKTLQTQFGIQEGEHFINSYSCALSQKILLQGRMYIYKQKVCFHSYFNDKNIFVGETVLSIPIEDIQSIQKKTTALIFDNGILVNTKKGEIIFASFIVREECFVLINKLINKEDITEVNLQNEQDLQNQNPEKKLSGDQIDQVKILKQQQETDQIKQQNDSNNNQINNNNNNDLKCINGIQEQIQDQQLLVTKSSSVQQQQQQIQLDQQQQQINKKSQQSNNVVSDQQQQEEEEKKQIQNQTNQVSFDKIQLKWKNQSIFKGIQDNEKFTLKIKNFSSRQYFYNFFYDKKKFTKNGKTYLHFWEYIQSLQQDHNIQYKPIQPQLPEYYTEMNSKNLQSIIQHDDYYYRELVYIHPINESAPFAPKVSTVSIKEKLFFLSEKSFISEREIQVSKVPLCDVFCQLNYYKCWDEQDDMVLEYSYFIKFLKYSLLKSMIFNSTVKNTKEFWNIYKGAVQQEIPIIQTQIQQKKNLLVENNLQQQQLQNPQNQTLPHEIVQKDQEEISNQLILDNNQQINPEYQIQQQKLSQDISKIIYQQDQLEKKVDQLKYLLIGVLALLFLTLIFK